MASRSTAAQSETVATKFKEDSLTNTALFFVFYICGSVHHQSILLNNQRDAALSSRIYSSL
jgi:hypothetical protein